MVVVLNAGSNNVDAHNGGSHSESTNHHSSSSHQSKDLNKSVLSSQSVSSPNSLNSESSVTKCSVTSSTSNSKHSEGNSKSYSSSASSSASTGAKYRDTSSPQVSQSRDGVKLKDGGSSKSAPRLVESSFLVDNITAGARFPTPKSDKHHKVKMGNDLDRHRDSGSNNDGAQKSDIKMEHSVKAEPATPGKTASKPAVSDDDDDIPLVCHPCVYLYRSSH